MSLKVSDEFLNKYGYTKKKRKEDEEDGPYVSDEFLSKLNTLDDDIAPVPQDVMRRKEDILNWSKSKKEQEMAQESAKWYNSGLFEDGWDFGDVTKTILGVEDKKELKTFTAPETTYTLEELKQKKDYLQSRTWNTAEQTAELNKLTQLYNQKALYEYSQTLSQTKMDGQNHTVLEEIEILANMKAGDEKNKRKEAVLKKMEELGMDTNFYSHFAGDGDFDWGTFSKWLQSSIGAGLNTFNKGMLDTADVLLGNPLKALGWENNPISQGAEYYGNLYNSYRYDANLYAEKLGLWNIATDAVEGTTGALPNAIAIFMTGGASAGASAETLFRQAAYNVGNLLTKAGLTVETMMKNPQFWLSFTRTLGSDYKEAKELGASDVAASVGSILKSLVNSGIEIGFDGGSGIQGLPEGLREGGKPFWEWVESWVEEGGEETLQKFVGESIDRYGYGSDKEMLNPMEYAKEGLLGMFSGMALGGGQVAAQSTVNAVNEHNANKLTDFEKAVKDKIIENRIAQKEAEGKTLSKKDKADIEADVDRKLRKGYITAEEIEEVLGGEKYDAFRTAKDAFFNSDDFKNYRKTVKEGEKRISGLEKQLEALANEPNTVGNSKKYDAIQNRIDIWQKRIQTAKDKLSDPSANVIGLRNQMRSEVMARVKDSRLAESYRELARKKQKFTVDVNKYTNEYSRKTVQSIIDSGLGDNSNQFHETVEWLAQISADKNVTFNLTNNERLKGTEHYKEGYITNGFVNDNGDIVLNKDGNVLNTTVGHEITHVLKKTDPKGFEVLQQAVLEYAVTKEGQASLDARLADAVEAYKNDKNTTPEEEVTADIIGEYLFTDYEFVRSLSVNHRGFFEFIRNEIKYMAKIATAGSKEARELERVKKMFDKAWRENIESEIEGETNGENTQHSLVKDQKTIDWLEQQEYLTVYKAMQVIDGKLYPPMSAEVETTEEYTNKKGETKTRKVRKLKEPSILGRWQQSDERPDLIKSFAKPSKRYPDGYGQFDLLKGTGDKSDDLKAVAYNPYEHTSNIVMNDQFSSAYRRNNLVTVEYHIPKSELTSGYKAQYAKDPVGLTDWKAGGVAQKLQNSHRDVYLTRWAKPVRVLDDAEVAQKYKEILDKEEGIAIPWNVVTPNLLAEMQKIGVPIDYSDVKFGSAVRTYEAAMRGEYGEVPNLDDLGKGMMDSKSIQYSYSAIPSHKKSLEKNFDFENASMDLETINQRYDKIIDIWERLGGELDSKFLNDWNNKVERPFTIFKAQAGYKYNVELSSMCKKGVPLFEAIDTIVKQEVMNELGTDVLGKEEKEILYDILKQHHFEIPCAICYVEQARQREGVIIDAFLNGKTEVNGKGETTGVKLGWNNVLDAIQKEMKANGVDYNFAFVSRDIATDKYTPVDLSMDEKTYAAFTEAVKKLANEEITRYNKEAGKNRKLLKEVTPEAVKECFKGTIPSNLKIFKVLLTEPSSRFKIQEDLLYSSMTTQNLTMAHNGLYSLFNSQGGVSGYKTKQAPTVYWGEILGKKWKPSDTRKEGGIRNQSNSDFQMYTLLDQAQMYMDFSAKGYYLQAYTKVLSELKLFGLSKSKINASLIPKVKVYRNADGSVDVEKTMANAGLDENGNPFYDDIEGINHKEAFMLLEDPEYSKNIGGICIGYSDNHIRKLLDDNRVQLIIGFHDKTNDPDKRYRGARYAKNYNGLNEAVNNKDGKTVHIGFNPFVKKAEDKFKYNSETELFEGIVEYNGKTYTADDIPRLAADLYLEHCAKKNYTPAYDAFKGHQNYYKLLADFSLYDSQGHYAPHQKVAYNMPDTVPYLDGDGNKQYMDTEAYIKAELEKELAVRDSLAEALADTSEEGIIPQFKAEVNKRKGKTSYSFSKADAAKMDADYLDAVNRGDKVTTQDLVDEAAVEWGAYSENGKPIKLYRGTSNWGGYTFQEKGIFATSKASIAAGYGHQWYADPRELHRQYAEDDGTVDTLIKNAKNVLDLNYHVITETEQKEILKNIGRTADEIADVVNDAWTNEAVDALAEIDKKDHFSVDDEYAFGHENDLDNAISYILGLPSYVSTIRDDVFNYDYEIDENTVSELRHEIERINHYRESLRDWLQKHRNEVIHSEAKGIYKLIAGSFDLTDFAIDVEYKLLRSIDPETIVNETGNLNTQEQVRTEVERRKNIGSYVLYGKIGDKPLIIDGKGRMFTNVPVDIWSDDDYGFNTDYISKRANEEGYTSVWIKNIFDTAMNNYSTNELGDVYIFFDSKNVRSADPVTYDNNGNVIPLSKRFDRSNDDIRYSMTKVNELENAYQYDLDNEDMLGAEMVVEEMANLAMPDSKIRGEDGRLIPVYHGTNADFWEFDTSADGGKNGTAEGFGIYLSDDTEVTEIYGDRQIKMFANITKPATSFKKTINKSTLIKLIKDTCMKQAQKMVDEEGYDSLQDALRDTWISNYVMTYDMSMEQAYREIATSFLQQNDNDKDLIHEVMFGMAIRNYDQAMDFYRNSLTPVTGIDGFITKWTNSSTGKTSNIYLAFDSSQLKSADAVTYDDHGNVIPLAERFNFANKDIRYSMSKEGAEPNRHGNWHIDGRDFGVNDPLDEFAPVREDVAPAQKAVAYNPKATVSNAESVAPEVAVSNAESVAPYEDNWKDSFDAITDADAPPVKETAPVKEISTVAERIKQKIDNAQAELDNNRRLREQSFKDYEEEIASLQAEYEAKKNKNSLVAQGILRRIERLKRLQADNNANYAKRISDLEARVEKLHSKEYSRAEHRRAKQEEYTQMWEDMIGNTSTWKDMPIGLQYKVKTLRRILRKVVKDDFGNPDIRKADEIYDELETKYDHNEALLKKESARLKEVFQELNLNKWEDTYAHMAGEFRHNPQSELTAEMVKEYYDKHKKHIDINKVNKAIEESRKTFDELIGRVNKVLKEQGFKEIPYRQGYFPHFTNPKQNWLQKLLNWKPVDTEIPTSIAGLTETFKPQRSWQSFDKQRQGDKTDYSLYQGLDTYIHGALDWIYHIEDLQKRRALENHIRYVHSDEGVKERIKAIKAENYDADEAQQMIDSVLKEANNPLSGLVRELMNRTNTLANKKSSMDRGMEDATNRKIYSTMTNLNNRINANMVVGSFSSALTNFIPMVQSWHQVSPVYTVRGLGDFVRSVVKDDGIVAKSDYLTNRLLDEEKLYQTGWDKVSDKAAFMMNAIDNITSQTVWRSKYLQNIHEGMSESAAIKDADQFAKNLMAGRSRGNAPTIFDAKNPLIKIATAFQLEVANQYGYMFEDVPQDSTSKARLVKGYATAFVGAYLYNALYSSLVGRDAAFDPIGIIEDLLKDLFDDDDDEPEDVLMDFGKNIIEEVPFVGGLIGGGRIPMSSALPYSSDSNPFQSMLTDVTEGNWDSFGKELLKPLYYLAMPVGGGQIKKSVEGLGMFLGDHPVAGSYTDSGKLRFPVEPTFGNVVQAGLFGQYASKNARDYFDNERSPLGEKQIQEYMDVDLPIADYWSYRDGLKELNTLEEKMDYIDSLDLPTWKKNLLVNNIADRKKDIDMESYSEYDSLEEFDFAQKNPKKYKFLTEELGVTYQKYSNCVKPIRDAYDWAFDNPEAYTVSKAISDNYLTYYQYKDEMSNLNAKDANGNTVSGLKKQRVIEYINGLDLDYGQKIILYRSMYDSKADQAAYNADIVEYLNSRDDISREEMIIILKKLGFTVSEDGTTVTW